MMLGQAPATVRSMTQNARIPILTTIIGSIRPTSFGCLLWVISRFQLMFVASIYCSGSKVWTQSI